MKKVLFLPAGLLLTFSQAFAQTTINPICALVEALANNFNIIIWLIIGTLAVLIVGTGVIRLVAGKAHETLVIVLGGAILLIGGYRLLSNFGDEVQRFKSGCQNRASINLIHASIAVGEIKDDTLGRVWSQERTLR